MSVLLLLVTAPFAAVHALCGSDVRWSHNFNMDDVYGMWYGVGYAQHTPDYTNKPKHIGCVTLHISDATIPMNDDWLMWSTHRSRKYNDRDWRSHSDNPFSDTPLSSSWLDVRVGSRAKRDIYDQRRVRVIWDEDGQTMEQNYAYTPREPGLWTVEQFRPMEREFASRGIDIWYPDDPPRHPEVIRVLKVSKNALLINHCADQGGGGVFTLLLQRTPSRIDRWQWLSLIKQFYNYGLPVVHRHAAVCAACTHVCSIVYLLICAIVVRFLYF